MTQVTMMNTAPDTASFATLNTGFLSNLRHVRRASDKTIRNYQHTLEKLGAHLVRRGRLASLGAAMVPLSAADLRAFLSEIQAEGTATATRRLHLSAVRSFLRYVATEADIAIDAAMTVRGPRRKRTLPRPVHEDAALALSTPLPAVGTRAEQEAARNAALFALLYGAGLRISEALQLNWTDVTGRETLRVRGKGSKLRDVPILPVVRSRLEALASLQPQPLAGAVFCGNRGGRLHASVAQRAMRARRATLGLDDRATPHALRHAFSTHLLSAGADLRVIGELLGHASLASTQIYTEVDTARLLAAHAIAHPRGGD